MTPEDMARIHTACFPDRPWNVETLVGFIDRPGTHLVTDPDQRGFLLAQVMAPEAEILTLAVDPEARRQGVASRLLSRLASELQTAGVAKLFLEVADDNIAAHALYRAHGFTEAGRRKSYYTRSCGPNADALIMLLELT